VTGVTLVAGAGPAGLTAAYELARHGRAPQLYEQGAQVGGISRTEQYLGHRFDIGGHRFYTKEPEIQALWETVGGDAFREVKRLSRIYYGGRFYDYPLTIGNVLANLGPAESARITASYLRRRLSPCPVEDTFETWVTNRFGDRLYNTFFRPYTEKVWGIPCSEIRAEWAAQRIAGLSLRHAVAAALGANGSARSLIHSFHYPELGPGQMWERFAAAVEQAGGRVNLGSEVMRLGRSGDRVVQVDVMTGAHRETLAVEQVISSLPLGHLVARLDPPPPPGVVAAAGRLRHRSLIVVGLIVRTGGPLFPDQWIYIHGPRHRVGRIQNYRNWSPAMSPDPAAAALGMEYFCSVGDELWGMPDAALADLAGRELEALGLAPAAAVTGAKVLREPLAYPVYDEGYRAALDTVRGWLASIANLQTVGRNGMHRYNNQDHAMLTGLLAARNLLGERHDLWQVNTEQSYHETVSAGPNGAEGSA
jgi:protoporphyrinogen oxidase